MKTLLILFSLIFISSQCEFCLNGGVCVTKTNQCICKRGWGGANCGRRLCPGGKPNEIGNCVCDKGWHGTNCQGF
jgi:hypothetical protein